MMKRELWEGRRRAMLTVSDLGEGFRRAGSDEDQPPDEDKGVALMRFFGDEAGAAVMVSLQDSALGSPAQSANATYYGSYGATKDDPTKRIEILDAELPDFGEEAVHYVVRRPPGSQATGGETFAWRHGEVVASLTTMGPNPPPALGFARRLHEKMVEVFGESPVPQAVEEPSPPIPRTACPGSHPIKAVADGPERLYYLPADWGYEEAMAEACYASVAGVEAAGYRRAGDPNQQWRLWP